MYIQTMYTEMVTMINATDDITDHQKTDAIQWLNDEFGAPPRENLGYSGKSADYQSEDEAKGVSLFGEGGIIIGTEGFLDTDVFSDIGEEGLTFENMINVAGWIPVGGATVWVGKGLWRLGAQGLTHPKVVAQFDRIYKTAAVASKRLSGTKRTVKDPLTGKFIKDIDVGKMILLGKAKTSGRWKRLIFGGAGIIFVGGKMVSAGSGKEITSTKERLPLSPELSFDYPEDTESKLD